MTKILVTGSAGFLGSHLCRHIIDHTDWQVVGLDRLDFAGDMLRMSGLPPERFAFSFHDLRSPIMGATSRNILTGQGRCSADPFDYVVHMAAGSHVDRSIVAPVEFFQDNVLGTVHLLEWLRTGNVTADGRTIYFSTDEVFGPANDNENFVPWARMHPLNPYSAAKAGGELACPAYVNCYGMRIIITHATNFFGESGQDDEKFIPLAIKRILAGDPVYVHTVDGKPCSRYYTHAENGSSAVLHLLKHGDCLHHDDVAVGRYNLTGEREISNVELVESIAALLGRKAIIKLVENPPTRIRPDLRYRVSGDALQATGWVPSLTFEEGLKRTVQALTRNNPLDNPGVLNCPPANTNDRSLDHG